MRRVVITGLGTVNPCGIGVGPTWEAMLAGRSGIGPITHFDTSGYAVRIAGEVRGFDGDALLGRRATRRLGRFMQFALVACDEALGDAGYDLEHVDGGEGSGPWPDGDRLAVYIGSGIGGLPEIVEGAAEVDHNGPRRLSPFFIPKSLINLATGSAAIRYQARGPSLCLATACAVGNHSIGEAYRAVCFGDADVALAGGTEAGICALGVTGFMNMKALSTRNAEPERASRPFDRDRDGFVMGEGAGIVCLEALEHAQARGARIYAEVIGYAATTDAHHVTAPAPGGAGAARCMKRALAWAGVDPSEVDYINAHGTSTPANDPTETLAIRSVFGDHADQLAISSTKGVSGHLLGAAGGLEAVATVMALHTGVLPPTANLENPDPECDLDYVPEGPRQANPRIALSNGFGFGGTNAVLALKRWEE